MHFVARSLWISAGVIVWALHFAAIYGFTALACARGLMGPVPSLIGIAGGVAAAIAAAIVVRGWRRRKSFEHWLSASVAGFALVAIVFETIPALAVPACA